MRRPVCWPRRATPATDPCSTRPGKGAQRRERLVDLGLGREGPRREPDGALRVGAERAMGQGRAVEPGPDADAERAIERRPKVDRLPTGKRDRDSRDLSLGVGRAVDRHPRYLAQPGQEPRRERRLVPADVLDSEVLMVIDIPLDPIAPP